MEEKKTNQGIPTVSKVLPDGSIIELVYTPEDHKTHLAIYRKGSFTLEESVNTGNEHLVPISPGNNLLKHRVVLLPEQPEEYESVETLLQDIQAYLYRYVDLTPAFSRIASCYILLTWVYDVFNELPYLRLRGDYGSGKTRALLIIGSVCYKPFFASGASTVSPIFHTLDTFRGTLIFDEADFRFSDEKAELVKIFNNGNVRGFPVLRTAITLKREFDPRAFLVYGPKIVAMRNSFDDQALESRFITEEMGQRTLRKDIPINLPEIQKEEAQTLRNKLLMYRFQTLEHTKINKNLIDPSVSARLNQILIPLLSIIEDEGIKEEIRRAVSGMQEELRVERSTTPEGELLELLVELTTDTKEAYIPLSEITNLFIERHSADYERPITNRYIGHLLRKRLRLSTYKRHGVYVLPLTEQGKILVLAERYGIKKD
ncbi:MAG: hypothetical protein A2937_03535 [Candidatus Yonathbacteria bacterium RIFCSPLOWO2_01_FULL_47_33b]|uniref:DUF3631 domain-containing protein n=1 Tax=Candidatus Yonathbacteria bacterium RIFCSPLOWO2_01_FULL_47_33b TaxID=1802727 RepID=A0A1G2SG37_9BACT|nr:MAG: hypothetical protein A2937_03535 [Candidatus Yonathbacteria bacterium RIFCSPLOWO2_01_FULL_47_33b]